MEHPGEAGRQRPAGTRRAGRRVRRLALVATLALVGATPPRPAAALQPPTAACKQGRKSSAGLCPSGYHTYKRSALPQLPAIGFASVNQGDIRRIAEDTTARATGQATGSLRAAARAHGTNGLAVFRSLSDSFANVGGSAEPAVNRAIARGLISGDVRVAEGAIRDLFRDRNAPERESYRKLGNKIVTVGKAEMTVRAYAMTVVRTRTREATVSARHERLGASGISLVQITGNNSTNFCTAFIGLVCSLAGEQTIDGVTYPALSSLPNGGPPFHPNCSKGTAAYVPDLVSANRASLHARAARVFVSRRNTGRLLDPVRA